MKSTIPPGFVTAFPSPQTGHLRAGVGLGVGGGVKEVGAGVTVGAGVIVEQQGSIDACWRGKY
jgi:hypothetical protein